MKKEYLNEIWKPIKGYEGLYEVSNFGRIRSLDRWCSNGRGKQLKKGKILKPQKNRYGYLYINLYKNGIMKHITIHKLVAEVFLPNPNNLPCVNHKDECKSNNVVNNLEWCSYSYNINFGTRNKRMIKKRCKPVVQYTLDGQFVREWESTNECYRNGFNQGAVAACCRGERKTYKGFLWEYK